MSDTPGFDTNETSFSYNFEGTDITVTISVTSGRVHNIGPVHIDLLFDEEPIGTVPLTICFVGDTITWKAHTNERISIPIMISFPKEQYSLKLTQSEISNVLSAYVESTGNIRYNLYFPPDNAVDSKGSHTNISLRKIFKVDPYVSCNPCFGDGE